jgi:hypothetical protein
MITSILSHVGASQTTIKVDDLKIVMGVDEWADHGYLLEIMRKVDDWGYSISVGKSNEAHYREIYPEGVFIHYDSDGFYNLTEILGYEEGEDDKVIYEHLKKYCRNINIEKLLEGEID